MKLVYILYQSTVNTLMSSVGRKITLFKSTKTEIIINTKYLEYKFLKISKLQRLSNNNLFICYQLIQNIEEKKIEYIFEINFSNNILIIKNKHGIMDIFTLNLDCKNFFQSI